MNDKVEFALIFTSLVIVYLALFIPLPFVECHDWHNEFCAYNDACCNETYDAEKCTSRIDNTFQFGFLGLIKEKCPRCSTIPISEPDYALLGWGVNIVLLIGIGKFIYDIRKKP